MSWTKGQIISDAFGELALAGFDFDISPEEEAFALRKLNAMMASWSSLGINVGFHQNGSAETVDLEEPSGIAMHAIEAVVQNLAVRMAASKGKTLPRSTSSTAKSSFDALISKLAAEQVQQQQLPTGTPLGAGRKPWRTINRHFVPTPDTSPLQSAADGGLTFTGEGNDAAATLGNLLTWLQSQLTSSGSFITQYAAPSATGFTVTILPPDNGTSMYLLLTPAAGYAAGTITLPAQATCVDGQEILVACTQSVTTLTVSGNGSTVNGAPSTLAANSFFRLRFDGVFKAWYRIG